MKGPLHCWPSGQSGQLMWRKAGVTSPCATQCWPGVLRCQPKVWVDVGLEPDVIWELIDIGTLADVAPRLVDIGLLGRRGPEACGQTLPYASISNLRALQWAP